MCGVIRDPGVAWKASLHNGVVVLVLLAVFHKTGRTHKCRGIHAHKNTHTNRHTQYYCISEIITVNGGSMLRKHPLVALIVGALSLMCMCVRAGELEFSRCRTSSPLVLVCMFVCARVFVKLTRTLLGRWMTLHGFFQVPFYRCQSVNKGKKQTC